MQNNLVSIITVTYNANNFIRETIQSVISQSYSNIEYIIIDGNSSDNTVSIIKEFKSKITFFKSEPDNGIFDAMNKAVQQAKGTWVNFMNAGDSFCHKDSVLDVVNAIGENLDIVCGDNYLIHENGNKVYSKAPGLKNIWNSTIPCNHQSMFIKRSLLLESPFNLNYDVAADYDFIVKQYVNNIYFQFLDFPICNFLTGGMSQQNSIKLQIESLMIMSKYAPSLAQNISKNIHLSRLSSLLETESKHETFLYQMNKLVSDLKYLESQNKKIIIYGASSIGRMIARSVPCIVDSFVDRGEIGDSIDSVPVLKPENIKHKIYDYIVISLLGREKEITEYLVDECNISKEKIYLLEI